MNSGIYYSYEYSTTVQYCTLYVHIYVILIAEGLNYVEDKAKVVALDWGTESWRNIWSGPGG